MTHLFKRKKKRKKKKEITCESKLIVCRKLHVEINESCGEKNLMKGNK